MTKTFLVNGSTSLSDIKKYRSEGCRIVDEKFKDTVIGEIVNEAKPVKKKKKSSKPTE